jgi:hypothetical protein
MNSLSLPLVQKSPVRLLCHDIEKKLATLLRAAATKTVPEKDFCAQFKSLVDPVREPVANLAYESAIHYWGNFHQRNRFLIRVKPDRHQVQQGRSS